MKLMAMLFVIFKCDSHDFVNATNHRLKLLLTVFSERDSDSELASVEIGDSIETTSATGVIINITQTACCNFYLMLN